MQSVFVTNVTNNENRDELLRLTTQRKTEYEHKKAIRSKKIFILLSISVF